MQSQLLADRVLWLLLPASCEVEAGCSVLSFVSFGLAFGDLPEDPSGEITAWWWRTQRIDAVCAGCSPCLVDCGGLSRAAVERGGEPI